MLAPDDEPRPQLARRAYTVSEIKPPEGMEMPGPVILTEGGIVAGSWYVSSDAEGNFWSPLPFVFVDRKRIDLHPGSSDKGAVYGGDDSVLVGSLVLDSEWVPVQWAPVTKGDWRTAEIKFLDTKPGRAFAVSEGRIWVNKGEKTMMLMRDMLVDSGMEKFDYVGTDERGWRYGTRYSSIGAGTLRSARNDQKAAIWKAGEWVSLHADGTDVSGIVAVSSKGIAAGRTYTIKGGTRACVWDDKGLRYLERYGEETSIAYDINNLGAVAGTFQKDSVFLACLWDKDGLHDISRAVKGVTLEDAIAINDRGQVVATSRTGPKSGWRASRLFLLTPRS